MTMTHKERDAALTEIARQELSLETLKIRLRDRLDFSEQSVWAIKAALVAAFELGAECIVDRRRRR